jgi:DNA-binding IclR family transcriptional regulator
VGERTESGPTLAARQPRAIHSALTVLEAVASLGPGVTAREISGALGLPRATTYRLLNLLVEDEYLVRTRDLTGFALGAKVVHLAAAAAPPRVSTAARRVVSDARREVRGGVHLVLFDAGRLTVLDADADFPLSDEVGLAREPERFALGRLMLATAPHAPARADPHLAAWRDDLHRLGMTRQIGELAPASGCLALPITDDSGAAAGALGFSGPRHRIEQPSSVLAVLQPAAAALGPLIT